MFKAEIGKVQIKLNILNKQALISHRGLHIFFPIILHRSVSMTDLCIVVLLGDLKKK